MSNDYLFANANIKHTQGRQQILDAIVSLGRPADVSEILLELSQHKISIDRTTVFRAINLFVKHGILKRIELSEGKFRYELASLPHHHHLVCTSCGRIDEIKGCTIPKSYEQEVSEKSAFTILSHSLEFFGLCKDCQTVSGA